jgi:peptidoglycan/xylan/chitin deacetylase (PgdA/CDA1 family)
VKIPIFASNGAMPQIRSKKAVLTYHRILDEGKSRAAGGYQDRQFYDLSMQGFREQMKKVAIHTRAYKAGAPLPCVALTFDDGTEDHLSVANLLAKFDLGGIFFIITSRLGQRGYLSRADLRTLRDLGQQIGSHSVTHRRIINLADAELRVELEQSRDMLQQQVGHEIEWFAPPGGFVNERCVEAARKIGYRFVRTMRWGYASAVQIGELPSIPVLPRISEKGFDRIINGRALFYGFYLKEMAKKLAGEGLYIPLRNRLGMRP